MKIEKIAIIGFGYVGRAVWKLLADYYNILIYDPKFINEDKGLGSNEIPKGVVDKKEKLNEADLAIVCVPTPMGEDGSCDISIVEENIKELEVPLILIKSTIPPTTTKNLKEKYKKRIVFSPEYIGEGKYFVPFWKGYPHPTDMKYHNFQIFGGDRKDTKEMVEVFQQVLGPDCQYFQTDSTTAEMVKYMENSWGATKVTFCNEFFNICEAFGIDYREVRELFLLDKRVERIHTSVFENKRGFGGKCFPKDLKAIIKASKKAGYSPKLLEEVSNTNERIKKENKKCHGIS